MALSARDFYNKFLANNRRVTTTGFNYILERNRVRTALYKLRKKEKETFNISQEGNKLIIYDPVL